MSIPVWRMLLPELSNIPSELDEELFQALIELERKRASQSIPWQQVATWSADQTARSVTLTFEDETELTAQINIIGTLARDKFMWGWHNPSIQNELKADSLKMKTYGEGKGWSLFSEPMFPAYPRDAWALTALAVKLLKVDGAYAGDTGDAITFLTLHNLPAQPQKKKKSIFQKVKKMLSRDDQSQINSPFDLMNDMINDQIAGVQIELKELRDVEMLCRKGHECARTGQHAEAARTFGEAWKKLGQYAGDQEPASYIKLAQGEALFQAGQVKEALNTFEEAENLYHCPDAKLLFMRLGQCYAAGGMEENAINMFMRMNVFSGPEALDELAPAHKELVVSRLAPLKERRLALIQAHKKPAGDELLNRAAAVVTAFIEEMHAFEISAHERAEAASKERTTFSEICDEDILARERTNKDWSQLLLVWCVPGGKSPVCLSIQSPPAHDPAKEKIVNIERPSPERIYVYTTSDEGGYSNNWRFELNIVHGDLLIDQVFSVYDDGDDIPNL